MKYFVYILECNDGTLYTGCTIDLEKRVHQHNHTKAGAKYTKLRRPVTLKYFEECEDYHTMRVREIAIKKMTRKAKISLFSD